MVGIEALRCHSTFKYNFFGWRTGWRWPQWLLGHPCGHGSVTSWAEAVQSTKLRLQLVSLIWLADFLGDELTWQNRSQGAPPISKEIRRPLCFGWGGWGGAREAWSIDCLACLPSHQRDRLRAMYPFPSLFAAGSKVGSLFDAYGHVHPSAMFPPAGVLLYCLWRFEQPRRIDEPSLQRHMLALLRTMYPTNVCLSFVPHPSTFVFSGFENG